MDIYVFIYPPGEATPVPAGLFTYDETSQQGRFEYGRRYQKQVGALAVDPVALPLGRPGRFVEANGGLYGAFRDASPDRWGRLVIAHRLGVPPETLNEGELLLSPNALRVGNLDFRPSLDASEPVPAPPGFHQLGAIMDAAARVEAGEPLGGQNESALLHLLEQGSGLGGARPKCTVEHEGSYWVAKFPSAGDTWNNPRVEWATMRLAARCGIVVPEMRLENVGGRDVLLLKRFDRVFGPGGAVSRRGYLSALSALQLDDGDREDFSYIALADVFREKGIGDRKTLRQLFMRMVFNIFCRNTDDHPRNHGVVFDGGQGDLSPAFDITPALARRGVGEEFSLSMTVGAQGRAATIENALSVTARFGLTADAARTVVAEMRAEVADWRAEFNAAGVSERDMLLFEPSFESRQLRVERTVP